MKGKWRLWLILGAVVLAALVVCVLGAEGFNYAPFQTNYTIDAPSNAFFGKNGSVYIIDGGKKHALRVDDGDTLGLSLNDLGYASLICDDEAGNVYIATVYYAGKGTIVGREAILRFDADGKDSETLYEVFYDDDARVMQYGNILSMRESEGDLVFSARAGDNLEIYTLDLVSGGLSKKTYAIGEALADAYWNESTGEALAVTRSGKLLKVYTDGNISNIDIGDASPWRVYASGDAIYFTDLKDGTVKLCQDGNISTVMKCDFYAYTANVRNGVVLTTDYETVLTSTGEQITQARIRHTTLYAAAWIALFVLALAVLLLLLRGLGLVITRLRGEVLSRALIIVVATLLVSVLVTYLVLSETNVKQRDNTFSNIKLLGDVMVDETDATAIPKIKGLHDTGSEAYMSLRAPLDTIIDAAYASGLYYYYVIYVRDGDTLYTLLDYEDTVSAYYPAYAYEGSGYEGVLEDGETIIVDKEVSAYGTWSYVIMPITGEDGAPIAVIEIGLSMDQEEEARRQLVENVALTVISAVVVIVMLAIELLFFAAFTLKKKQNSGLVSGQYPLRSLVFIAFFADSLQDGFIAILLTKLYTPVPLLPVSVGAALPMTAQLLFCALAALCAGRICSRAGVRKSFALGFALQMAGFALCAIQLNYWGLLVGKSLAGFGMGLICVTANTVAALDDEAHSAEAFSNINAGLLGGCAAGAGVGSILLTVGSFKVVFFVAAACAMPVFLQMMTGESMKIPRKERTALNGIGRFLTDKRAITFLTCVLFPFLVVLSFRDFCFPIFAETHGLDEVWLSRIYMLSGLVIIYLGPNLTRVLTRGLGYRGTAIFAGALLCGAIVLFACLPSLSTSLIALALLSLSLSFGYNAQSAYYSHLPAVTTYGEARAMGVYSLFDSVGQTAGPLAYGLMMTAGGQSGVLAIGLGAGALLLLFTLLSRKKG